MPSTLLWLRNDLRVSDHPALQAAIAEGPVVPVYILDDETPGVRPIGGAQRWWLHHSLAALDLSFRKRGSALVLRRGSAIDQLQRLVEETGCRRIHATRQYEPWYKDIETKLAGTFDLFLHDGNYLAAPDSITNAQGERYRMFTPWYRQLLERMPPALPLAPPDQIVSPDHVPSSDLLEDWQLRPTRPDWASGFADKDEERAAVALLIRFRLRLQGLQRHGSQYGFASSRTGRGSSSDARNLVVGPFFLPTK